MTRSNLQKSLDRFPPFLVRALAHCHGANGRAYRSTRELQKLLGWAEFKTKDIAGRITWQGISIEDADHFASACGVNLHRLGKVKWRLKQQWKLARPFEAYLNARQLTTLETRLARWAEHMKAKGWK